MDSFTHLEQNIELDARWNCQFASKSLAECKRIALLLHGYQQSGKEILNQLCPALPADYGVISPDAPFPIPVKTDNRWSLNFAWYFFDRETNTYHTPVSFSVDLLKSLMSELYRENPSLAGVPLTVIGYSQGGYIAPFLADQLDHCDHAIMIGARLRSEVIEQPINAHLTALHGIKDRIVDYDQAKNCFDTVKALGQAGEWISCPSRHSVDEGMLLALKQVLNQTNF